MSVSQEIADKRVTEWFRREQALRESRAQQHRAVAPIAITISREYGAGGHTVAEGLVEQLGKPWEVWDRAIIEKISASAHVQTEMVRTLDEHSRTWVEEVIRLSMGVGIIEQATFRKHMALVLASLAQQGHAIIIGRGANLILPTALNVRLMAAQESRIQSVMEQDHLDHAAALKKIHVVDRERADYTRTYFGRDIDDLSAYDMVLSTSELGIPATIEAIAAVARVQFGAKTTHRVSSSPA